MAISIHEQMLAQMQDKQIFEQAKTYAYQYADKAWDRNVFPADEAIEELSHFDDDMPQAVGEAENIIHQLHQYGSPATVSQIGGRYFGFVNGGVIPVSLAARWLSDWWDQNTALHLMSPIASKLERVTERWLQQLFGLNSDTVAGYVSGTSTAIICGLAAARYRTLEKLGWDINQQGLNGAPNMRIITGKQTHSAVVKGIALMGFGTDNIEWADTDEQGRVIASSIDDLDESCIIILQAGNVNSGSFDPIEEICDRARSANAWVHIDGAFGLWVACASKLSYLTKGMEKANSWSVDGHKTLNTPYDNGIILCDDKEALVGALQASAAYIMVSENRDGMFYTPEMSRRARIVELWAALKYLGREGIDQLVFGLHQRAKQMGNELQQNKFEVLNDVVFNQVLVGAENDAVVEQIAKEIQASGECWVGTSKWHNRTVIRISICSWATTRQDVNRAVNAFVKARDKVMNVCKSKCL